MSSYIGSQELPLSPYASKVAISRSNGKVDISPHSSAFKIEKGSDHIDQLIELESGSVDLLPDGSEEQNNQVVRGLKSRHILSLIHI